MPPSRHREVCLCAQMVPSGSRLTASRPHSELAACCVRTQRPMRASTFCRARVSKAEAPWAVAYPTAISRTV